MSKRKCFLILFEIWFCQLLVWKKIHCCHAISLEKLFARVGWKFLEGISKLWQFRSFIIWFDSTGIIPATVNITNLKICWTKKVARALSVVNYAPLNHAIYQHQSFHISPTDLSVSSDSQLSPVFFFLIFSTIVFNVSTRSVTIFNSFWSHEWLISGGQSAWLLNFSRQHVWQRSLIDYRHLKTLWFD